jgi:valyl-tRNA synthetase
MTKVLRVYGDDYAAMIFEDETSEAEKREMFDKVIVEENKQFYDEDSGTEYEAYEFGQVDQAFIEFIHNNVLDYDMSKHDNFFIIKD